MATKIKGKREKYGMFFPAAWSHLDIELYCFKTSRLPEVGGLGKPEHFWNIIKMVWGPKNYVGNNTKQFIRNPWSEQIVEALSKDKYIAVGGCAGSTKSETCALWVLISYLSDARGTLGLILSTSLKEARKRIWGSLVDFIRAIPNPGLPLKVVDSQGIIRYTSPSFIASDRASISLVAAERKQEKEAISKLLGQHNNNVIVIADELSELTPSILEFALPGGNLTSNPRYQFVGLSNPGSYYDPFAKLWKPKRGWTSISVEDDEWETEFGIGLHFDGLKSPNVLEDRVIYPFLPTTKKIEEASTSEGGENSIRFWRMIRGFMCPTGQESLIYAESDIVKFKADEPAVWNDQPVTKVAGFDPGFTNDGDRSILYIGSCGVTKDGIKAICYDRYVELVEDVTNKVDNRSYQIARKLRETCEAEGILPRNVAIDATGAGAPFCDVVDVVWSREVLRVKFGGKASDLPVSLTDPAKGFERYFDRVTELWYSAKDLLRNGQLKGISPDMAREMCARRYGTTGAEKRIYVESKADMKLRTGRSPDIADAAFILVELCRQRLGFAARFSAASGQKVSGSWRNLVKRLSPQRQTPFNLR